jgi:AcrR family transcriptional regulator/DNA-binding MarR family transcriptional regulator
MLSAMTEVAAERGAGNVTVAHVVARSGVSRRTFYDLFEDREDCLMAALEDALGRFAERVVPVYGEPGRWRERIRRALSALLEALRDEPAQARLVVVESLAAGPIAMECRARVTGALIAAVDEGREEARPGQGPPELAAEGVVGAVLSVIHARLVGGGSGALTDLVNQLMGVIVLPYLGPAAARRELTRPAPDVRAQRGAVRGDPLRDLDMRLTYRTVRVLIAIAAKPGASNREIADGAGIADQGQMSKLLARLQNLGLAENSGEGHIKGEPNAWRLTPKGWEVEQAIRTQTER